MDREVNPTDSGFTVVIAGDQTPDPRNLTERALEAHAEQEAETLARYEQRFNAAAQRHMPQLKELVRQRLGQTGTEAPDTLTAAIEVDGITFTLGWSRISEEPELLIGRFACGCVPGWSTVTSLAHLGRLIAAHMKVCADARQTVLA